MNRALVKSALPNRRVLVVAILLTAFPPVPEPPCPPVSG